LKKYCGLTDNPDQRKIEHGNPPDFRVVKTFTTESEALKWQNELQIMGFTCGNNESGWRFGYIYIMTLTTNP